MISSTVCWRRYVCTWEIKDNWLYLVDITGSYQMSSEDPIVANWFSGVIEIPDGAPLGYHHMEGVISEQVIRLEIENGQLTKSTTIDNPKIGMLRQKVSQPAKATLLPQPAPPQWYIARNGQSFGPFAIDQLLQNQLTPQTFVWRARMNDWQPASTIPDLAALFPPS